MQISHPTHLFTSTGQFLGVFIPASMWDNLDKKIQASIVPLQTMDSDLKEPLADWEHLLRIWDFPYPVDTDVLCESCGSSTLNWQHDQPRRFTLKAASIGGLVAFECARCRSRIRKNHFKDGIEVTCTPSAG